MTIICRATEVALPGRLRAAAVLAASIVVIGSFLGAPLASAAPSDFPDIDFYAPVDPGGYQVNGAHPSSSGWTFSTAAGFTCQDNFIAELGVFCQVSAPGPTAGPTFVSASVSDAGQVSDTGTELHDGAYPLLPTGMRLTTDNGVDCAVLTDETLACRAIKPAKWGPNVPNPPDRVYGEHGFVINPSGSATTF